MRGWMVCTVMAVALGCLPVWAQGPAVSNLTWTQGPNGAIGTKVDIHYDLASPNGNCTVSAKLSKDNGATFPFNITTASGDIGANITPGTGKHIVWDVAADFPNETLTQAKIRILVDDGVNPIPVVTSFAIDGGAATTVNVAVTLDHLATNGPTDYMASESPAFSGAAWQPYAASPSFTLSSGVGPRTVYFKVRNASAESGVVSDAIFLLPPTVPVASGTFDMGRRSNGDDATYGDTTELPVHTVTLGAYQIGKGEVTNNEYCDVLNWALAQGLLKTSGGADWTGTGDLFAGGNLQFIVSIASPDCDIKYSDGVFSSKARVGLPGTTTYSMDAHPMVRVSWYGAAAFCNWLSQMQGLTPCYDMTMASWPLTVAPPVSGGYRLPTEAEWERAAAWDPAAPGGPKHWIYGFTWDTLSGKNRCNYYDLNPNYVNPLGLTSMPYTSPAAWFDGLHVSPNASVTTIHSVSPAGAYDMTGNVNEWCHDWYLSTYYASGGPPWDNPAGPASGGARVLRGGGWTAAKQYCRTAYRSGITPTYADTFIGLRIARSTPSVEVTSFAINSGAATSMNPVVTLNNTCTGEPTDYMASESASFSGAAWQPYDTTPPLKLSLGVGARTVFFKVRNAGAESGVVSDTIFLLPQTVPVASGPFDMGRRPDGDDAYGDATELPVHTVSLGAYQIGKGEVTNKESCDVLNWALAQGYLKTAAGDLWAGTGDIYAGGDLQRVLVITSLFCNIQYSDGAFSSKTRVGLPDTTTYSMDAHPVVLVTWYGSVAFCNWLSQWQGLTPCYDMDSPNWPLSTPPPAPRGYRLPTEAEWERAAAWDGSKHWIYGFASDTLTGKDRCNYYDSNPNYVNPLGLTTGVFTAPDAWFDGVNVSLNGSVTTINSVSPAGAYDMSGNACEWCDDWYLDTYYASGGPPWNNPSGPVDGTDRVLRGGGWNTAVVSCRTALRSSHDPTGADTNLGFRIATSQPSIEITSLSIDSGAETTSSLAVTLNNTAANNPADYMASESPSFSGAAWQTYVAGPSFTLSFGVGTRTVYFKVRNSAGESGAVSDTIFLLPQTVSVASGTFDMGRRSDGDDATYGDAAELPVHTVTLGAYQIGKGEVTNKEYCNVLNWSLAQGYLKTSTGAPWAGTGNIYAGGDLQILLAYTSPNCNIQYSAGVFSSKTRMGLPGTTAYSTDTHPVVLVSWYGSVAFCNWLSQWQGLTPCYDMSAANWPLIAAAGGYRLPTEAEWERAAAWDGSKHWIYGFASDTLTGKNQCNYYDRNPHYVDPLGLTTLPFTSPDAWFNGVNVSPNGSVATINGVSPVGAYDMSGNALEWCHDWYEISYYSTGGPPWNNPTGPADGTAHAVRGGGWYDYMQYCRTAFRNGYSPASTGMSLGFRVAKSN